MASIISSKVNKENVILSLKLEHNEAKELNGHVNNIHLIAEDDIVETASLYEKGRNGNTKYFLIPRILRKKIRIKKEAKCIMFDKKDRIMFVYFVGKG